MKRFKVQPESEIAGVQNIPQIKSYKLSSGSKGNIQTIKLMRTLAHQGARSPKIRKLALNILNYYNTPSHHYADESLAIGTYVQEKVRYVQDAAGIEQVHDPLTMVDQIEHGIARADCDDMALLIATLLLTIGHRPKFRAVRYKNRFGAYSHIYVVDYVKNGANGPYRLVLDAIVKNQPMGFEVPHKNGKEFAI